MEGRVHGGRAAATSAALQVEARRESKTLIDELFPQTRTARLSIYRTALHALPPLTSIVVKADCTTFNCTEGGILFGKGINFIPLQEFFSTHPR